VKPFLLVLLVAVLAVLRKALEAEADALLTALPEWLVRAASRLLPRASRDRWRDEVLADLDTEPNRPLWRLVIALRFVGGLPRLRWAQRRARRAADVPAPGEPQAVAAPAGWFEFWAEAEPYLREWLTTDGLGPGQIEAVIEETARRVLGYGDLLMQRDPWRVAIAVVPQVYADLVSRRRGP
jgi:hypothetical protein